MVQRRTLQLCYFRLSSQLFIENGRFVPIWEGIFCLITFLLLQGASTVVICFPNSRRIQGLCGPMRRGWGILLAAVMGISAVHYGGTDRSTIENQAEVGH